MRRYDGLTDLAPSKFRRPAVTIGTFDGLHLGHVDLLNRLRELATRVGGESVVVTFATHPMAVIRGAPPRPLLSLERRLNGLAECGVDAVVVTPFDEALRTLSWASFVDEVLVARLGIAALLFGWNGNFGHGGLGTFTTVRPYAERLGILVEEAPAVVLDGRPVSSTRIRDAIEIGDLEPAARLLGRAVDVAGPVGHGDGRGRTLGFPTANVGVGDVVLPPNGVYEVRARVAGGPWWSGVANLGRRPTIEATPDGAAPRLEVHLLDYRGDLYGSTLHVEFIRRLREERRFSSVEALSAQIRRDVAEVAASRS